MASAGVELLGDPAAPHLAWFLHGILGQGRNFRTFARQVTQSWPSFRVLLPDLRNHGEASVQAGPALPPHDLSACARDLAVLATEHGAPNVVIGHSFGGKVALAWAEQQSPAPDTVLWVLDSPPGSIDLDLAQRSQQQGDPARILALLRTIAVPAPDRDALRRPLREAGISETVVQWLLTSARQDPSGWRWVWDLDGVESMLRSYAATDFWPWLSQTALEVHLVRAARSDRWSERDLQALGAVRPPVHAHLLENAGHWLHVDNPAGTMALLAESFAKRA
jgi:esterase